MRELLQPLRDKEGDKCKDASIKNIIKTHFFHGRQISKSFTCT